MRFLWKYPWQILGVKAPSFRIYIQEKYGSMTRGDGAIYLHFPNPGYRENIWDHVVCCIVIQVDSGIFILFGHFLNCSFSTTYSHVVYSLNKNCVLCFSLLQTDWIKLLKCYLFQDNKCAIAMNVYCYCVRLDGKSVSCNYLLMIKLLGSCIYQLINYVLFLTMW